MNRDETVELFLQGREAWNAWAKGLLAERKALEAAGTWKSRRPLWEREKGENPETQAWLDKAFADFSRCLFLLGWVEGTEETPAKIEEKGKDSDPPVKSIQLGADRIDFEGFVFPSGACFNSATFTRDARFQSATFNGDALFESATFTRGASFESATFTGGAWFDGATFTDATFTGGARFNSATFTGNAWFLSATFTGCAPFDSATFNGNAWFNSATFTRDASFDSATFTGNAWFDGATFTGDARFFGATFTGAVSFDKTQFKRHAEFQLASFKQYAGFELSRFEASASFYAIRGERGFDMAGAIFEAVPDFIQAHFEEAPQLDNLKVHGRWIPRHPWPDMVKAQSVWQALWWLLQYLVGGVLTWPVRAAKGAWRRMREGDSDIPARWRALKRLAIQGHDTERELEYHARELQSQRFEDDWPLPFRVWSPASWVGFLRFWFGMFYGLFSDFGRSTIRPALLWLATVAVFAMYFLSGQPYAARPAQALGYADTAKFYARLVPALWRAPPPCYRGAFDKEGKPDERLTGLVEPAAASTNALREAIRLAFRNGSVILDGGEDAMHRTYGCLYGIERYGGNPVPFVPGFVTDASGIQKVLSALYIFLFGLALRNMLKMK
jgi:hypothetical protein